MGKEIEKKFLVKGNNYKDFYIKKIFIKQGFLNTKKERVVRIRTTGEKAYITIKGTGKGAVRPEFEYEIPVKDAIKLLETICEKPIIEKNRHIIPWGNFEWEVDEFLSDNNGLVIAEIELQYENQEFPKPDWLGTEVTDDPKYFNSNLVKSPYSSWQ